MTSKASIVLPTYDEPTTAPQVIRQVDSHLSQPYEVVVMDDSPTPETAKAIQEKCADLPVSVTRREAEPDLSQAILDGFDAADGERLVVLDADGQHPPSVVPTILQTLESADVAIGSRHSGGEINAEWSVKRYAMSFGASVIAWLAVPDARGVQDPMSGFFGVRRSVVEPVRTRLHPRGYKILLEILARCPVNTVAEVPVEFRRRDDGESNTDWRQNVRYLRHMGRLAVASRRHVRPRRTAPAQEVR